MLAWSEPPPVSGTSGMPRICGRNDRGSATVTVGMEVAMAMPLLATLAGVHCGIRRNMTRSQVADEKDWNEWHNLIYEGSTATLFILNAR